MAAKVEDLAYQPTPYIITQMCIGGIFVMINAYLVIKEISQRIREKPKFKSCGLKWLSMLSVNGGLLLALAWLLHYFDGICLFLFGVYIYVRQTIPICVGLYQLSRLYQCFADNVSGGYPKWLFYVMGIYGILYAVVFTPYKVWNERTVKCGLTDKYQYYVRRSGWQFEEWAEWRAIGTSLYLIWDISTLLLFGSKIRSLTNGNPAFGKSATLVLEIRRNMTRIVILTIFYMVMQALDTASYFVIFSQQSQQFNVWYWCMNTSFNLISTTAVSYAAFLMQPHNSREYGVFLNLVICLKLHFCCCCYHKDVVSQRDHFLPNTELELVTIHGHNKKNSGTAFNEFSMNDSPSIMIQQQSMRVPPMTLSSVSSTRSQTVEGNDVAESAVRPRAETDLRREMLTNDFLFEADSQTKEEFSSGFSFGVYLEYWRRNKNNSVWPKYSTLREELTKNRHSTITEEQFETLLRQCVKLRERHPFSAKDIGTMNIVCGILPGSIMTVDHVICIKLYTDFTVQQAIFKKHCRRLYKGEPIVSVIRRNKEIAHWSRLLRECIMFFGENMTASDVVYCGLNALLIFRSLHQRFECPLSTTMQISVAQHFAGEDGGVILKLKRSNPKTRYLDVSPFTLFKHEDERLFSGSTLKIVDIFIGLQSLKKYINALRMLEQIANGHIIDFGVQTGGLLLSLLRRVVALSVMEVLTECISDHDLGQYLEEEDYDTDAVLDDIEIVDDSNAIMAMGGNSSDILKLIKSTIGMFVSFPCIFSMKVFLDREGDISLSNNQELYLFCQLQRWLIGLGHSPKICLVSFHQFSRRNEDDEGGRNFVDKPHRAESRRI